MYSIFLSYFKNLSLLLLCCIGILQNTHSQELVPSDSVAQELTKIEKEMFRVVTEGDKPAAEKLFAHDYITIDADGVMQDKEMVMQTFGRFKGSTAALSDKKIRISGNLGIINGKAKFYLKSVLVAEVFYTELWILRQGQWEFVGWQGTMTGVPSYYSIIITIILLILIYAIARVIRKKLRRLRSAPHANL